MAHARIEASVGSVGDSYCTAPGETVAGLHETSVIRRRGLLRGLEVVEFATLEWVHRFNHRRSLEPIGDVPPAERERAYDRQPSGLAVAARLKRNGLWKIPGRVQSSTQASPTLQNYLRQLDDAPVSRRGLTGAFRRD